MSKDENYKDYTDLLPGPFHANKWINPDPVQTRITNLETRHDKALEDHRGKISSHKSLLELTRKRLEGSNARLDHHAENMGILQAKIRSLESKVSNISDICQRQQEMIDMLLDKDTVEPKPKLNFAWALPEGVEDVEFDDDPVCLDCPDDMICSLCSKRSECNKVKCGNCDHAFTCSTYNKYLDDGSGEDQPNTGRVLNSCVHYESCTRHSCSNCNYYATKR